MATFTSGLSRPCRSFAKATVLVVLSIAFCLVATHRLSAVDRFAEYDLAMFDRPKLLEEKSVRKFAPGLKELWFRALDRPDAELQRMVIDTIAIAHQRGVPGMAESKEKLIELMNVPNQRIDVLRSIAQTLIVIGATDQADALAELSMKRGVAIAEIVEPALVDWESPALLETWMNRLSDGDSSTTMTMFAIEGLAALQKSEATEPLQKIVLNSDASTGLRLAAARALGKIHDSDLVDAAKQLVEKPSKWAGLNETLAIELLAQHQDAEAIELLDSLVGSERTSVQAGALEQLFRIDADRVDRHADKLVASPDANVRRWCARAMAAKKTRERIQPLAAVLNDVNPGLRREVAQSLLDLAEVPELRDEVLERTTEILRQNDWRGCEQACVVLTKLDHKPSGKRMVELLGHERGEVKVASAWGLTRLRIESLLPDMLEHAQSVYEGFRSKQLSVETSGAVLQIAHLFIAFGDQKYEAADPLLRQYIPKKFWLGLESRAAAAWALGLIHEGDPPDDLVPAMIERIRDIDSMEPEAQEVTEMCAVSLGRMNAESALPALRDVAEFNVASYWAIELMTGEKAPPQPYAEFFVGGWFLSPIIDRTQP